jgi:hypothetical protein
MALWCYGVIKAKKHDILNDKQSTAFYTFAYM